MKSLSILFGTAVIALSTMATSNVAVAGAHDMKTYLAPYYVNSKGKKMPRCKKGGYEVVWKNHKAYCVPKKKVKDRFEDRGYKSDGIIMWSKHNGKYVARCIKGYRLVKKPGKRAECVKKGGAANPASNRNNTKYDMHLIWTGNGVKCGKGKFWHKQNKVHCSKP